MQTHPPNPKTAAQIKTRRRSLQISKTNQKISTNSNTTQTASPVQILRPVLALIRRKFQEFYRTT
jgi:hypothetical protein